MINNTIVTSYTTWTTCCNTW